MDDKVHIIKKVQAELTVPSENRHSEKSEKLREAVENAVRNLEPFLDEQASKSLYQINSLTVNLSLKEEEFDSLQDRISEKISKKIREALDAEAVNADKKSNVVEQLLPEERYSEILTYFLKTGNLPWWTEPVAFAETEQWAKDLSVNDWISILKPLIKTDPTAVNRFVMQFSDSVVDELIQKSSSGKERNGQIIRLKNELLSFARKSGVAETTSRQLNDTLRTSIIQGLLTGQKNEKIAGQLLNIVIDKMKKLTDSDSDTKKLSDQIKEHIEASGNIDSEQWLDLMKGEVTSEMRLDEDRAKPAAIEEKEGQRVINAGVVILHPFLQSLFKNSGFIEDGAFRNKAAMERAVCMVHHLSTGEEEFPEYALLMPKFLCGWPLEEPVNRYLKLSESEMKECEVMLLSSINHWEALKHTSADGLRNNFLQREGILRKEEFGWSVYMEQNTIDILLEKLPWNLGIIKLPWMDEMVTVNWH